MEHELCALSVGDAGLQPKLLADAVPRVGDLRHTTLATARLRFLFLAAKIVRHAGAVVVRYSDHYAEQGTMGRLMDRLRAIEASGHGFAPVVASALRL